MTTTSTAVGNEEKKSNGAQGDDPPPDEQGEQANKNEADGDHAQPTDYNMAYAMAEDVYDKKNMEKEDGLGQDENIAYAMAEDVYDKKNMKTSEGMQQDENIAYEMAEGEYDKLASRPTGSGDYDTAYALADEEYDVVQRKSGNAPGSSQHEEGALTDSTPVEVAAPPDAAPPAPPAPNRLARGRRITQTPVPGAISVAGPGATGAAISNEADPTVPEEVNPAPADSRNMNDGLVEAQPVDNEAHQNLTEAEQFDPEELQERQKKREKECRNIGFATIGMAALLAIIAVIATRTRGDNDPQKQEVPTVMPSIPPTTVPSLAPTDILHDFILSLPNYTMVSLEDPLSPQSLALEWLQKHPELDTMPDWRREQLFALVTFYHAFDGDQWREDIKQNWQTYEKSECIWYSTLFGSFNLAQAYGEGSIGNNTNTTPCNEGRFEHLALANLALSSSQPTIPPEITMLTDLKSLFLPLNNIMGNVQDLLPLQIFEMTQLEQLSLQENFLSGTLPTQLGLLPRLQNFFCFENAFTGTVPSEVGQMSSLTNVFLEDNALSGTLPTELGLLTQLDRISLFYNSLTGPLPKQLGQLTSLSWLQLSLNALSGTLSTEFGLLAGLTVLALDDNSFQGSLPSELGLMTSLSTLYLDNNAFTGNLPTELGLLTQTKSLTVDGAMMTGTLPTELGLLTEMRQMALQRTFFTGSLPSELGLLTLLNTLAISKSALTGTLPDLMGMASLSRLILYDNALTGPFPIEVASLTLLEELSLNGNLLTGSLPAELSLLANLTYLEVQNNAFTGIIPTELGVLVSNGSLRVLTMRINSFVGTVPDELCQLRSFNEIFQMGLSFDCHEGLLCGCCFCPCPGTEMSYEDLPCSPAAPYEDGDWDHQFATPVNSTNIVTLNIYTDSYPIEIFWEWSRSTVEGPWKTIDSGNPPEADSLFAHSMEVQSNSSYRLTLTDVAHDGFCCGYGVGWLSLTTPMASNLYANGTVVWEGLGYFLARMDLFFWVDESGIVDFVKYEEEDWTAA